MRHCTLYSHSYSVIDALATLVGMTTCLMLEFFFFLEIAKENCFVFSAKCFLENNNNKGRKNRLNLTLLKSQEMGKWASNQPRPPN